MGITASGFPYPEGTDHVVDGDNAIRALAEAVETHTPPIRVAKWVRATSDQAPAGVEAAVSGGPFLGLPAGRTVLIIATVRWAILNSASNVWFNVKLDGVNLSRIPLGGMQPSGERITTVVGVGVAGKDAPEVQATVSADTANLNINDQSHVLAMGFVGPVNASMFV